MERLGTKTQTAEWSQIGLPEYLLVAYLNEGVNEKVIAEKQSLTEKYLQKTDPRTQSYITIASFMAREPMEETIIRYTQRICSQVQSFNVQLNNYSGQPPNTIYLRIQDPKPFRQLAKELMVVSNYISSCACPPAQIKAHPHLTISRRLPDALYLTAMMDYSQKTFHEEFSVIELVLLRRNHSYDTAKKIHVFRLQPQGFRPNENNLYN